VSTIRAIFWDVGGVLLTNAWDHTQRMAALEHFRLDEEEFHSRHEMVVSSFERGKITLDEYLDRSIFYRNRPFTRDEFRDFIFAQSQPQPDSLRVAEELGQSGRYFLATLNNEILELNVYRIEKFGLRRYFSVFFSSCFLGLRKPDEAIYRAVLQITQRTPEECIFIDDREVNLECPRELGINTILFRDAQQLRIELVSKGVV